MINFILASQATPKPRISLENPEENQDIAAQGCGSSRGGHGAVSAGDESRPEVAAPCPGDIRATEPVLPRVPALRQCQNRPRGHARTRGGGTMGTAKKTPPGLGPGGHLGSPQGRVTKGPPPCPPPGALGVPLVSFPCGFDGESANFLGIPLLNPP